MHIFAVYCHPDPNSFTGAVKNAFLRGLAAAGHTYTLSDLYEMRFDGVLSPKEYGREAYYQTDLPVPADVLEEQRKINAADAIAFLYPVFWTEAPALLTG